MTAWISFVLIRDKVGQIAKAKRRRKNWDVLKKFWNQWALKYMTLMRKKRNLNSRKEIFIKGRMIDMWRFAIIDKRKGLNLNKKAITYKDHHLKKKIFNHLQKLRKSRKQVNIFTAVIKNRHQNL